MGETEMYDITSIDTTASAATRFVIYDAAPDPIDTVLEQRDAAIAEAEVRRKQVERLTEENAALARRVAELGMENARLRTKLIEAAT